MKRILSLLLAAVMLVSAVPTAFAADTNDYSAGTKVEFTAANNEAYTITVPALLAPGGSGSVTLSGTWPDNRTVSVTADPTVTLTSSIKATDTKTLDVNFAGISEAGSNIETQTFTKGISVDPIENAIFGTWSGQFNYNVEAKTGGVLEGDGQTFHTMAPSTLSFRSAAPLSEFQEVQVNGVTVDPSNYALTEGSTIVTLSIDYLKTLDVAAHEITVVSESGSPSAGFEVVAPPLNEQGFYYNQPYTSYVDAFGDTVAFFIRKDGTLDCYFIDNNYIESCSFTSDGSTLTISTTNGNLTGSFSSDGKEFNCNELDANFVLGDESIVADEDYIYIYDSSLGGYKVRVIDASKSSYSSIRTGLNDKPTVSIEETFKNYTSLVIAPVIPESVTVIGYKAFNECHNLTTVVIPSSITSIGEAAFANCGSLTSIIFEGTVDQWNAITKGRDWKYWVPATEVICSDGTVALS